ncbi:cytochrome c biogenesis protein ResB [Caldinitratiruptor microaerophilus]|uniref:Cytochrome c biogenesis protein ResB n=1 Tax=Caldinitratiruptor microaerophilus TaxID=671077 RepID=A0AA35CIY5_9FIRM|nr:cytochrome c biogenesis protein ResB [Caldinitratiruptor microaerophilus]BDG60017.1 cytochrome c biogenesis protein ResB [Caldinitratiruptor microaerophilus]
MSTPGGAGTRSAWTEFLDAAWDFFASTRVATVIIFLIAVASIAGSLIEQEGLYNDWRPPELYYPARYGPFWGNLFMQLGLTHAYKSFWFVSLVYLGVISLIVCSLQRLVPLHRALQRPQAAKPESFVRRLPVVAELPSGGGRLEALEKLLRRRGFRVWTGKGSLHADRGRLSRYGPYVIHIGLIIAAFAATSKVLPGWDVTQDLWVADGQTVAIPGTRLAIRNEKFTLETYPSGMPKEYRTDAVLIDSGQEVKRAAIEVNHPLRYQGWEIYQASWREEPGVALFRLVDRNTGRVLDDLEIDLKDPAPEYATRSPYRVVVREYYPDFTIDPQTKQPTNKSRDILNPVFLLSFTDERGAEVGRQAVAVLIAPGQEVPLFASGPVYLEQTGLRTRWYTGLKAHRDRSVPFMFAALTVVMIGMGMTFFLFHRQLWAVDTGARIVLGGWTYKNRLGLQREVERIAGDMGGTVIKGYRGLASPAAAPVSLPASAAPARAAEGPGGEDLRVRGGQSHAVHLD